MTSPLAALLRPRRVAVVGLTGSAPNLADQTFHNLHLQGFTGELFAVGRSSSLEDRQIKTTVWPAVSEIRKPIDLAIISQPVDQIKDTIIDCGYAGVRLVTILEDPTCDRSEYSTHIDSIASACHRAGVRLVGPTKCGLLRPGLAFNVDPGSHRPMAGNIGLIGRSALAIQSAVQWLAGKNSGVSCAITTGLEWDASLIDLLPIVANDRSSKVLGVDVSAGIPGPEFYPELRRAADQKPTVVLLCAAAGNKEQRLLQQAILQHGGIPTTSLQEFCHTLYWLNHALEQIGKNARVMSVNGSTQPLTDVYAARPGDIGIVDLMTADSVGLVERAALTVNWQRANNLAVISLLADDPASDDAREYLQAHGILVSSGSRAAQAAAASLTRDFGSVSYRSSQLNRRSGLAKLAQTSSSESEPGHTVTGIRAKPILHEMGFKLSAGYWVRTGARPSVPPAKLAWPVKITAVDLVEADSLFTHAATLIRSTNQLNQELDSLAKTCRRVYLQSQPDNGLEIKLQFTRDAKFGILTKISIPGQQTTIDALDHTGVGQLTHEAALTLICDSGLDQLLGQWPKSAPRLTQQLAQSLVGASSFMWRCPEIKEVQIDPLLVSQRGLLVLDSRVATTR